MDLEFKKKIEERMKELPKSLAEAIEKSGWEKAVFDIGRKHSLHVDDIGNIQNELILVLTGLVHPDEFRSVVINEIGIKEEKADAIIEEINVAINDRIRERLKEALDREEMTLKSEEVDTMKKAGVSLGEEVEEKQENVKKENPTPQMKLPETKVFKTQVKTIDADNKPKGFLDPYRESVE